MRWNRFIIEDANGKVRVRQEANPRPGEPPIVKIKKDDEAGYTPVTGEDSPRGLENIEFIYCSGSRWVYIGGRWYKIG